MGALAFLLIFVALDLAAIRWGVDTRTSHDPQRPLLVAERMSTTLNNPPNKGPSRYCQGRSRADPLPPCVGRSRPTELPRNG